MEVEKHTEAEGLLFPATAGHHIWLEKDQAISQVISYLTLFNVLVKLILQLCFKIIYY